MNGVLLDKVVYFPSLQTLPAELRALRELDRGRKRLTLPLITLTAWQTWAACRSTMRWPGAGWPIRRRASAPGASSPRRTATRCRSC